LPEAIKVGMSIKEFWYGDTRLLQAYQMAYYRSISYNAWLQGQYSYAAFSIVMANAFSKSGASKAQYPDWKDPMAKFAKPKVHNLDNNEAHNGQIEWFANMLQKK
jgi:hypothetical protein